MTTNCRKVHFIWGWIHISAHYNPLGSSFLSDSAAGPSQIDVTYRARYLKSTGSSFFRGIRTLSWFCKYRTLTSSCLPSISSNWPSNGSPTVFSWIVREVSYAVFWGRPLNSGWGRSLSRSGHGSLDRRLLLYTLWWTYRYLYVTYYG